MKIRKISTLLAVAAAFGLTACGGSTSKSSEGGKTSSKKPTTSSSKKPATSLPPQPYASIDALTFVTEDGVAKLDVKGSSGNMAADTKTVKLALGLSHINSVDGGEGYVMGSATPADADYKYEATLGEKGAWECKIPLSTETAMAAGRYMIEIGVQKYVDYATVAQDMGNDETSGKGNGYSFVFYKDGSLDYLGISVGQLPPMSLTEATIVDRNNDGHGWLKVGGKANMTQDQLNALEPFIEFQNVGESPWTGNWGLTQLHTNPDNYEYKVEGENAYLYVDMTSLGAGFWNSHINFISRVAGDLKMECDIADVEYSIGAYKYTVISRLTGKTGADFWGNLGIVMEERPHENYGDHTFGEYTPVEATDDCVAYETATCSKRDATDYRFWAQDSHNALKIAKQSSKTFKINVPAAVENAKFYIEGVIDYYSDNSNYGLHTGKNGGSSAVNPLPEGKTNTTVTVNGAAIEVTSTKTYAEFGCKDTGHNSFVVEDIQYAGMIEVGACALTEGVNTIVIAVNDSFAPQAFRYHIVG